MSAEEDPPRQPASERESPDDNAGQSAATVQGSTVKAHKPNGPMNDRPPSRKTDDDHGAGEGSSALRFMVVKNPNELLNPQELTQNRRRAMEFYLSKERRGKTRELTEQDVAKSGLRGPSRSGSLNTSVHTTSRPEGELLKSQDAILQPKDYFATLDDIENEVRQQCAEAITLLRDASEDGKTVSVALSHIMRSLKYLQETGFCAESFQIILQDPDRHSVICAQNIFINDVQQILELTLELRFREASSKAENMLFALGILSESDNISVFAVICGFATIIYSGSFTTNLRFVPMPEGARDRYGNRLVLYRQRLACLHGYIGEPVWVFGTSPSASPASLSTSLDQFADMWGPTYGIPTSESENISSNRSLITVLTEGGLLFRPSDSALSENIKTMPDETPLHWIPVTVTREITENGSGILPFLISMRETTKIPPPNFEKFSKRGKFLIGIDQHHEGNLTPSTIIGRLNESESCAFDAEKFEREHYDSFHLCGTHQSYNAPDELQLALAAGQYVTLGATKVWKKIPASTYKKRLLFYLSNPQQEGNDVCCLLQRQVGFEMSACTRNSRRISLQQALMLAFPTHISKIEEACNTGKAQVLTSLIDELSFTGISPSKSLQLYWPSKNRRDIFEIKEDRPRWSDILEDTRDTACFAVFSKSCLVHNDMQGQDGASDNLNSCSSGRSIGKRPGFQTKFVLNKQQATKINTRKNYKIQLFCGRLETAVWHGLLLGTYERRAFLQCLRREENCESFIPEIMDTERPSECTLSICIVDS